jgi:hypothetical protein
MISDQQITLGLTTVLCHVGTSWVVRVHRPLTRIGPAKLICLVDYLLRLVVAWGSTVAFCIDCGAWLVFTGKTGPGSRRRRWPAPAEGYTESAVWPARCVEDDGCASIESGEE